MLILCTLCVLAAHHSFTDDTAEDINNWICIRLEITQNLPNKPNFMLDSFDQYLVWETVRDIRLVIMKCYGEEHGHLLAAYNKRRTINMGCRYPYLRQTEEARCREEYSNPLPVKFYFGTTVDITNNSGILKINASQKQLLNDGILDISGLMQLFSERNRDATDSLHFEAGRGSNAWMMKSIYVFHILQLAEIFENPWTFANSVINQYRNNNVFCQVESDDMSEYSSEGNLTRFSVLDDVECAFLGIFSTGKFNSICKCKVYMDNMTLTLKISNSSMYREHFIVRVEKCLWNVCESELFILQETIFQDGETILSLYMNLSVKQQLNFSNKPNYTVCLRKKNDRTLFNWLISQTYTYEIILLWRYILGRAITDEEYWQSNFQCAPIDSKNRNNCFHLLQDISCDTLQEKCTDSLQLDNIIKNTSLLFVLLLTFCKLCIYQAGNITVQSPTYMVDFDTGKNLIPKILGNLLNYCKYRLSRTVSQEKVIDLCGDRPKMKTTRKFERDEHLNNDQPHVGHSFNEDNKMHQNEFLEVYGDPKKLPKTTEHEIKFKSIPWYLRLQPSYIQTFATVLPLSLKGYISEQIKTPEEHKAKLMKYEWERYKSFQNFPSFSPVQPVRLAQAGFYYSNVADEVTCFSCGMKYREWKFGDIPNKMHAQMSPACSFISRLSENIPIASDIQNQDNPLVCSSDAHTHIMEEVGSYCLESTRNSSPNYCTTALRDSWDESDGDSELQSGLPFESSPGNFVLHLKSVDNEGIRKVSDEHSHISGFGPKANAPRYRQYIGMRDRLESFTGWPICAQQEPKVLAEAGLFYTGLNDCVRCFQCGGSLRSWQQNDIPWNEHARWYPDCSFVLRCKGKGFIEKHLCQQERHNVTDATEHSQVSCQNDYGASLLASANTIKENILHTDPVRTAIDMGFPVDTVQTAVKSLQEKQKNRNFSVTDLLDVLLTENSTGNNLGGTSSNQVPMVRSFVRNITEESEETSDRKVKETISYKEEVRRSRRKNAVTVTDGKDSETSAARLSQKDFESLMEENRVMKDQMTCKICMDAEACIVFLPCSHMMTCSQCAPAFRKCPMCRQLIRGTVRAHL